jgi:nitrite reductase/ring-hydroxylating ferredoxin subunit
MSQSKGASPKWREDFPFESEGDDIIARRDFIRFLGVVSAGLAIGNGGLLARAVFGREEKGERMDVCATSELAPGSWRVFQYPDPETPAILIRRESGDWIAFLQKCPHLSCPVAYQPAGEGRSEHLSCHCHNGSFDIETGHGVSGPPRELRPLRRVLLEESGGRVVATGLQEIRFGAKSA